MCSQQLPLANLIMRWPTIINGGIFMNNTSTVQFIVCNPPNYPTISSITLPATYLSSHLSNYITKKLLLILPILLSIFSAIFPLIQLLLPKILVACNVNDIARLAKQAPILATVIEVSYIEQPVLHCLRLIKYDAHGRRDC